MKYLLGIDQSTQGTKALLFDEDGELIHRFDLPHRQIIDDRGWVEHDLNEIFDNTIAAARGVVKESGIEKSLIAGVGICNQRETAAVWDKTTGLPVCNAIVWQCPRGEDICGRVSAKGHAERIRKITGLNLSPYFSAAKIAWVLENYPNSGKLCAGTIDSWLIYKLTGNFKTDYSNASRTQLFDITALKWSDEVCGLFGIDHSILPQVCDSGSCFGYTDFEGFLEKPIPINGVMGDSHGALFGQGCHIQGMMKATYGTGSSIMMNIGQTPVFSNEGIVTSIAWGQNGKVEYVLEGNINYSGAVIKWIVDDLGLIETPQQAELYANKANSEDGTYIVPAFSGLGAPYWNNKARAIICGISRTTGKAEIVRAAQECIAYQIADVVKAMLKTVGIAGDSLRVDGGAVKNNFLMQFQSDIIDLPVMVPEREELSAIGASYMAGIALGIYNKDEIFARLTKTKFVPRMDFVTRQKKLGGWLDAVSMIMR